MDCYKGNPFIDCLPPMMDNESFFLAITHRPDLSGAESLQDKLCQVYQIRNDLFVPLSYHYFLYVKVYNILRENYRMRTPIAWIKMLNDIKKWSDNPNQLPPFTRHPILGLSVLGLGGMGKSTMIDKIFNLFGQLIEHKELGIKQVVYLKLDCTTKSSTKQICRSFFDELDRITGENYSQKYQKDSEEKLMIQMANKAVLHQLGVLVIDEIHNLKTASPNSRQTVLNFFKELTNRIGVPIIYIGTGEAAPILFGNYQTASRTQGVGMQILDRFREDDAEWHYFLNKLWRCQVLDYQESMPEDLRKIYYAQSQGILREVIQVHCCAQEIALFNKCTSITIEHVQGTAQILHGTSPAMKGLASNNRTILKHFDDLKMTSAYLYNPEHNIQETTAKKQDETKQLFDFAKKKWPKLSYAQLDDIIKAILEGYPDHPVDKKYEFLSDGVANLEDQGKTEAKEKRGPAKGDLVESCVNAKTSQDYYDILKQNGVIVELNEVAEI